MSFRTFIVSRIAEHITSAERQRKLRDRAERQRNASALPHRIDYFHQVSDPYSCLLAQVLPQLVARYNIELRCHLVSAPPGWAAPEREKLDAWSRLDATRLARRASLDFTDPGAQPSPEVIARAESVLAERLSAGSFIADAANISTAIWAGETLPPATGDAASQKAEGDALRADLGHYLGGMLHYAGEWYWGLDRLHYLEDRLTALRARKLDAPATALYPQPLSPQPGGSPSGAAHSGDLHFYLSFRSPYTWIATARVKALAEAYGLNLRLRFLLPMVMRGLPVPAEKRRYISLDAAREARLHGVPFGRINDPVGRPTERGLELVPWAHAHGRLEAYLLSFMRGVWAEGIDAGSDHGLARIVERAGLHWSEARTALADEGWRVMAERNRQDLLALGLWGVPCFHVDGVATWGQDRLWQVRDALRAKRAA